MARKPNVDPETAIMAREMTVRLTRNLNNDSHGGKLIMIKRQNIHISFRIHNNNCFALLLPV